MPKSRLDPLSALTCALVLACSRPDSGPRQSPPAAPPSVSAAAADDCSASEGCRELGECARGKLGCEPVNEQHCLDSVACRRDGMCRLLQDGGAPRCGSETHADCARSALCREQGRCQLAPSDGAGNNTCISAQLRVAQRLPLTEARHGVSGELRLLVDSRLPASVLRDARGYAPIADAPMAAASLQLQTPQGAVRDELTLYPAVDIAPRNLGSGGDTFIATEHVACLAGRFCGWHAVFFEIKSGKLQRVRAVGPAGAERELVARASLAARWTLRAGGTAAGAEVVTQEEDPEKSVLVERRFFYRDGSWRFSEREASSDDPKMRAEPGQWAGSLD